MQLFPRTAIASHPGIGMNGFWKHSGHPLGGAQASGHRRAEPEAWSLEKQALPCPTPEGVPSRGEGRSGAEGANHQAVKVSQRLFMAVNKLCNILDFMITVSFLQFAVFVIILIPKNLLLLHA